ncbi:MAG: transposase [Methanophagales archaeon]|nr:transposase [Methanophagales archaeon]
MYLSLSLKHPVNVDRMLIDGTKCELLTFGYNPAGARKRQITIFLAVSEGENIPVHLRIGRENVRAYKIFREILADLKLVKRTFTTIVDNGFITAESLSDLKKLELHIVTRLRHDSKVVFASSLTKATLRQKKTFLQ